MTYILGLTGGIATGKSTVAHYFSEKGIPLVDADVIARKVVEPGTEGLAGIVAAFGQDILLPDGSLNRSKLGALIFTEDEKRHLLNRILQDQIRALIKSETSNLIAAGYPLIILDIPLLFERDYADKCDGVMVVYTTPEVQLQRLMARNQLSPEEAGDRIASQMPIEVKRRRADFVIDNNGSLEETFKQVDKWLEKSQK